jgi:hypothetical protein
VLENRGNSVKSLSIVGRVTLEAEHGGVRYYPGLQTAGVHRRRLGVFQNGGMLQIATKYLLSHCRLPRLPTGLQWNLQDHAFTTAQRAGNTCLSFKLPVQQDTATQ